MFVSIHRECIKKKPTFLRKYKIYGEIAQAFLRFRMQNFQELFLCELEYIGRFSNLH